MPSSPLPPQIERFLRSPRPAVVGVLRHDGAPTTTATWYHWQDDGHVLLSMVDGGPRERRLRADPRLALTVLGDSWYDHVSLTGRVVEFVPDADLADLDALSMRYLGEPYPKRHLRCVSVLVDIDRWHVWGDPGGAAGPHDGLESLSTRITR